MTAKHYLVCILAVTSSVIAAVYYVRVVLVAYAYDGHMGRPMGIGPWPPMGGGATPPPPSLRFPPLSQRGNAPAATYGYEEGERPTPHQAVIIGLCLYVIMFGLMVPNLMLQIAHDAVMGLY